MHGRPWQESIYLLPKLSLFTIVCVTIMLVVIVLAHDLVDLIYARQVPIKTTIITILNYCSENFVIQQ